MMHYIITGGSMGIGRCVIQKLIQQGYAVINLDITAPNEPYEEETFIKVNVAQWKEVEQALSHVDFSSIQGVFLNAGVYKNGTIESLSLEDIDRIININLRGYIYCLKYILPKLLDHTSVVLNGSDQSLVGKSSAFAYGLTKGAIGQMTKSLALDYGHRDIRVNCVCPGTIDTPLYRTAIKRYAEKSGESLESVENSIALEQPLKRIGTPKEVANLVVFLLSKESSFITGSLISIDGGYTAQ